MLEEIPLLGRRNEALIEAGEQLCRRNFKEGALLGSGSFAKVRRVLSLSTGRSYAMKTLSMKQLRQLKLVDQLKNELGILAKCQHEGVVTLYGAFAEEDQVFLLMELADCSLFDKMVKEFPLSEERVASFMGDIVRAVVYLHSLSPVILHRDLKPENVLVINGRCKIADFGWSNTDNAYRNTYCGTFDYLAPEMILGTGHSDKLDVWTLGVLMYELLEGKPPFGPREKVADKRLAAKITEKNILRGAVEFARRISPEAMAAIRQIVNVDEARRPTAREILELEFFRRHLGGPARSKSANPAGPGKAQHAPSLARPQPGAPVPAAAEKPRPPSAGREKPGESSQLGQRLAEARARLEAVETRNREVARLVESRPKRGEPRAPELAALTQANAERELRLAECRERLGAIDRKGQDRARSAQLSQKELLALAGEVRAAGDTFNQLTALNRELVEMVYACAKKPPPAGLAFDRGGLSAVKAELQALLLRRVDMQRKREQPTRLVYENGRYRVVSRSRSRERAAPFSFVLPAEPAARIELAKSFAHPPAELPPKVLYYQAASASPFTSR